MSDQNPAYSLRGSYEKELSDTRQLLDETAKEKERLQLDAGRSRAELGELTQKYNKAKNDILQAEEKVQQLETRNNELNVSLHQLKSDLARALEEKKDRIGELERNLETERQAHATAMQDASAVYSSMHQGEITRMREQIAIQLQKSQDLRDLKISTMRTLLEGEITRLALTGATSQEPNNENLINEKKNNN